MSSLKLYRAAQISLLVVLVLGTAVWYFIRPSANTSLMSMSFDIERVGRAQEVTGQIIVTARRLADTNATTPAEEVATLHTNLRHSIASAERLLTEFESRPSEWVPVAEAATMLLDAQQLGRLGLNRLPTTTEVPSDNPQEPTITLEETPETSAAILETRAHQLLSASDLLRVRVEQAIAKSTFNRGRLLGFEASDLLLGALVVTNLLATMVLNVACVRLSMPPEQIEKMELELIRKVDPQAALKKCHQRVKDLLELADDFCRPGSAA